MIYSHTYSFRHDMSWAQWSGGKDENMKYCWFNLMTSNTMTSDNDKLCNTFSIIIYKIFLSLHPMKVGRGIVGFLWKWSLTAFEILSFLKILKLKLKL